MILGVAASNASHTSILVAGVASLVAGAMSMATGRAGLLPGSQSVFWRFLVDLPLILAVPTL
ncbi:hypothetical protein AAKU61_004102 [Undibacterium sp. GrIS 1.2]